MDDLVYRIHLACRHLLSWVLLLALVQGGLALAVDGALMAAAGEVEPDVLALAALAAVALGVLSGAVMAPAAAMLALLVSPHAQSWSLSSRQGRVLLLVLAFTLSWVVLDPLSRRLAWVYFILVLGSTGLVALSLCGCSSPASWRSSLFPLILPAAAVISDCWLNVTLYPELHSLAHLLAVAGLVAVLSPLRRRLWRKRLLVLLLGSLAVGGASFAALELLERQLPTWPTVLRIYGRQANRLLTASRTLLGVKPGPVRLSAGVKIPGRLLCNGANPCRHSRRAAPLQDEEIGLLPPLGDAAYRPGTVDLVLLITVECFRADAMTRRAMPHLWAAARRGMVFPRAYAAASMTQHSLAAIHGKITSAHLSTADRLQPLGVITNSVIGWRDEPYPNITGHGMGFGHRSFLPGGSSAGVTDTALQLIQEAGRGRHHLWLHYWDSHQWFNEAGDNHQGVLNPSYLRGLARVDRELGRLFRRLKQQGRLDRALIIVTGDHGEAIGEHGLFRHARTGYEVMIRVPLVLLGPGIPARRFDGLVSHHDIPSTVMGAFGVESRDGLAAEALGRSLLRLRGHPEQRLHQWVVAVSDREVSGRRGSNGMAMLMDHRFKIHFGWDDEQLELYDLMADPGELENLVTVHPRRAVRMLQSLVDFCLRAPCHDAGDCRAAGVGIQR